MALGEVIIQVTTDGSGDAVVTASESIFGTLYSIEVVQGTLASTFDATIKIIGGTSGVTKTLLTLANPNANTVDYTRVLIQDAAGADIAANYVEPLLVGKPQVTIAQGGDTKSGTVLLYYRKGSSY